MKKLFLIFLFFLIPSIINAQIIATIAGNGSGGDTGDGGIATSATMRSPAVGIFDNNGNFYFTERLGNRVRKISPTDTISTFAGNGVGGFYGDGGTATNAELNNPVSLAIDKLGNIYIAEINNNRIRKVVNGTNIIYTVAGNGTAASFGDGGAATTASLLNPNGVCIDTAGNLYILETSKIRKVSTSGIISTIVGNGIGSYSGDGGLAATSEIDAEGIYVDKSNNIYIADFSNNRVRKVNAISGIITTIAGNGIAGYNGDSGLADTSEINPIAITEDVFGNLFIADVHNNRIRKIDTLGIIHPVAGNGIAGFSGDGGVADTAEIHNPEGVAIDLCGNLYIADEANLRIRKVTYPPILTIPTITLSNEPTSATVGTSVTITATVTNAGSSYLIHWLNHGIQFATTTVPSVTYTKPPGIDTITARVVSTATYGCYDSATSVGHTVSVSTGVSPLPPQGGIVVYPNPANNSLTLTLSPFGYAQGRLGEGTAYRIISIVGTVMQQGNLKEGSNSIPIQSLPAGMYMLEITSSPWGRSGGAKTITKFIKQ